MAVPVSRELGMLEAVVEILLDMTSPSDFNFPIDADCAWLVDAPQIKHLAEFTTAAFVSPGDVIYTVDTGCTIRSAGDFLVTMVTRHTDAEELASTDYSAAAEKKLKMIDDLMKAINVKDLAGITATIVGRNVTLEVDGWAVVQVQFSFEDSNAGTLP